MKIMLLTMAQLVDRRIGGLETVLPPNISPQAVDRRIGGLEILLGRSRALCGVDRRIGGLEITYAFFDRR